MATAATHQIEREENDLHKRPAKDETKSISSQYLHDGIQSNKTNDEYTHNKE